jgi:hypothetical protein
VFEGVLSFTYEYEKKTKRDSHRTFFEFWLCLGISKDIISLKNDFS